MIEFQHEGHEACYGRVKEYMTALFGEQAWASDEAPYFEVSHGSAFVRIMVDGFQNGSSFVSVWSPVVTDVEINADSSELPVF